MTSPRSSTPRRRRRLPKPRTTVGAFILALGLTAVIVAVSLYGRQAVDGGRMSSPAVARVEPSPEPKAQPELDRLFKTFAAAPLPEVKEEPPRQSRSVRITRAEPIPLARPVDERLLSPEPAAETTEAAPEPADPIAPVAEEPKADRPVEPTQAKLPPPAEPSWLKHAVPTPMPLSRPSIVLVIDDLGLDRRRSQRVTELPGPLTLAYLPYAEDLRRQTESARARGHELLLHVPMEPEGADADPGPEALLTSLDDGEILRRLSRDLARFEGYVGVNNHMGSRFTRDRRGMAVVLGELRRRGLLFLDSRTSGASIGTDLAREIGLAAFGRDVFIDHVDSPQAVRAALAELEAVARRKGIAVGIGHPHDVTYHALVEWLPTLEAKGFQIVPFSAMARQTMSSGGER